MLSTKTIQNVLPPESGFAPIPARIREVPPLVVEGADAAIRVQVVESLQELASRLAEVHRTAAEAYMSQGLYQASLPHLEAAVTFAPEQGEYLNQLGFVRYLEGDDAGALRCFERMLQVAPENADALFNMGMIKFGQEQFAEAESCFARSLLVMPNHAETWNNRGVCLYKLGRVREAQHCFTQALSVDPENEDAKANLARV